MVYQITAELKECPESAGYTPHGTLAVFTGVQLQEQVQMTQVQQIYLLPEHKPKFCKIEELPGYLYGSLCIPVKGAAGRHLTMTYAIWKDGLLFVDNSGYMAERVRQVQGRGLAENRVGKLFYELLSTFVERDLEYLEQLEEGLALLEDETLQAPPADFHYRIVRMRREFSMYFHYYTQLEEMMGSLRENENGFFTSRELSAFRQFGERAGRLREVAQQLREYLSQIKELYQAQIANRQNDIMKVLTVITAVFSPLTLIVGWYGMNFTNMPELYWKYGYLFAAGLCAATTLCCLWYIKRKKYL